MLMTIIAPERTGILGKLAKRLPPTNGRGLFQPAITALNFTNACNARCEMCLENANGKKFPPYTVEEGASVLRQVGGKAKSHLHLWGGEPFLNKELLFGIVEAADNLGFRFIEVATNGFWGRNWDEARGILSAFAGRVKNGKPGLHISCDSSHQSQRILDPRYLANIIYLVKCEFPWIAIHVSSVALNDFGSLHDLAGGLSAIYPEKVTVDFYENRDRKLICFHGGHIEEIPLHFTPLSLSGRCTPDLAARVGPRPLEPDWIASENSVTPHLSFGIDRQMYMHLVFGFSGNIADGEGG